MLPFTSARVLYDRSNCFVFQYFHTLPNFHYNFKAFMNDWHEVLIDEHTRLSDGNSI